MVLAQYAAGRRSGGGMSGAYLRRQKDLKQGAETYKNSRVEQANLQAGNYDNQPAPAQDFHKISAALGETAGIMQMNKPALEIVTTAASMMVGVEIPASAPLVTGTSFGLKSSVSLSENAVTLGGLNSVVKQTSAETLSPNVQKVVNMMSEIKAQGGTITPNPLSPNQELNLTINSIEKMDFRIETHVVPTKYGGNGVTPQRHMNVDLYPDKKVLPNSGHKILE